MTLKTCAAVPCKSCPYRRDVPSGIWHPSEYRKLPAYDGDIPEQIAGGMHLFDCHQKDGQLCAGWVGTHGPHNLLALRIHANKVDGGVWDYVSPVPLFTSGEEAAIHGLREIREPGPRAKRTIDRLKDR